MKPLSVGGHPLHPQLVGFPLGLFPFSFAMDVFYHITGRRSFADAAYYSMASGTATAMAAAAAGAIDYLSIPDRTEDKKVANTHAIMNIAAVGAYAANLAMRSRSGGRPSLAATILNGVCVAGLSVSQWYGGDLVYRRKMRVQMGEEEELSIRPPGDRAIERGLHRIARAMPSRGPFTAA